MVLKETHSDSFEENKGTSQSLWGDCSVNPKTCSEGVNSKGLLLICRKTVWENCLFPSKYTSGRHERSIENFTPALGSGKQNGEWLLEAHRCSCLGTEWGAGSRES